jgi:nucleoside-diphosphate-sugar epimerase
MTIKRRNPDFLQSYLNDTALPIYGNGEPKRDFVNIKNFADANIQAFLK